MQMLNRTNLIIASLILVIGGIIGYYAKPSKTETSIVKIEDKESKEKVSALERQVEELNLKLKEKMRKHKYVFTEKKLDGTEIRHEYELEDSEKQSEVIAKNESVSEKSKEKQSKSKTESVEIKKTESRYSLFSVLIGPSINLDKQVNGGMIGVRVNHPMNFLPKQIQAYKTDRDSGALIVWEVGF